MKINEIANMPYKLDISPTMSWGFDEKYYGIMDKDGRVVGFETRLYRRDKSVIWVSV